jgi:hypothetical protein
MEGLAALLTGLLATLGEIASVAAVVQFAIIFMMFCAVWAVVGDKVARVTFEFSLFAVPVGHEALPVLMNWTADATVVALRHSGVPVFRRVAISLFPADAGRWLKRVAGFVIY